MKNRSIRLSKAMQIAAALALMGALWVAAPPAHAGVTIPVNTTTNALGDGYCSLQEAVAAANTDASQDSGACPAGSGTDTITFHIGADGSSQTITLSDSLTITTPVTLDGTTQQSIYAGIPLIRITRAGTGGLLNFSAAAAGSMIKGLQFSVTGSASDSYDLYLTGNDYQVKGCYFNTDGTAALGSNVKGIFFSASSTSTVGGPLTTDRNLFGGDMGIFLQDGTGNTIQGNWFGVNTGGNTALTGTYGAASAIQIQPSTAPSSNTIRGNVIGGFTYGILLTSLTGSNTIAGNKIGVGESGSAVIPNVHLNDYGIFLLGSSNNTIGGTSAADRNVISGNSNNIRLDLGPGATTPSGNTIQGNYIGTSADGLTKLSSSDDGIGILEGSGTVIGGTVPGAGNVISGNSKGVNVYAGTTGTTIRGNRIGTDPSGTIAVGNSFHGIYAVGPVNVGDDTTPGNNVIAGNTSAQGIVLLNTSGTVYGNRIGVSASAASLPNLVAVNLNNSSATFGGNWIANNSQEGIYLNSTATVSAASEMNCFMNNHSWGVHNVNTVDAPFTNNWWESPSGPYQATTNPTGTGDHVTDHVTYVPYLTMPPAACPIFADMPVAGKEWMAPWVDAFYLHGITTGCGANPLIYCPENSVTRAAMAVFILRAIEGPTYTPPAAHGYFDDLPVTGKEWMEPWVDEFYDRGITTGCGTSPLRYCPENPVTRAAMAVFLLRALEGSSYVPDHTDHYFSDLPVTGKAWMEPFVDEFYERGITTGCGAAPLTYCPENPVTRAAMAVFIDRAYNLYP